MSHVDQIQTSIDLQSLFPHNLEMQTYNEHCQQYGFSEIMTLHVFKFRYPSPPVTVEAYFLSSRDDGLFQLDKIPSMCDSRFLNKRFFSRVAVTFSCVRLEFNNNSGLHIFGETRGLFPNVPCYNVCQ